MSAAPKSPRRSIYSSRGADSPRAAVVSTAPAVYNTVDVDVLRRTFERFDKNKNGTLERDECAAALAFLGATTRFDDLDLDGDCTINFSEFAVFSQLVGKHTHPVFKRASRATSSTGSYGASGVNLFEGDGQIHAAFQEAAAKMWRRVMRLSPTVNDVDSLEKAYDAIDVTRDGTLDASEIRQAIKTLAPQAASIDVLMLIACADKDRDGRLSKEEVRRRRRVRA